MNLSKEIIDLLKTKGFDDFSEAQKQAIPLIKDKHDVLVIAPTGSGKTEAAVLPILDSILEKKKKGEAVLGIQALYITPLRALNRDMLLRLNFWCDLLGITIGVRHGDTSSSERAKQRDLPPNFLITTPETLESLLIAPKLSDYLKNVEFVVVDEVHELVDSKRGIQLSVALQRLKQKTSFQTIGLSATVGDEKLVSRFLSDTAKTVKIGLPKKILFSVELPTKSKKSYLGLSNETNSKLGRIIDLILTHNRSLIFVNTRYTAESLASLLMQIPDAKDSIAVHHSSLSKESRLEVEEEFKKNASKLKAIICTSSLELGIDVGAIDLVIQYVSPRQASRLLQRVGRSGHKLTGVPKGIIVATDAMDALEAAALTHKATLGRLEELLYEAKPYDILIHQLAGLALDYESITKTKALEIIQKALPFVNLSMEEVTAALEFMQQLRIIILTPTGFVKTSRTKWYYYENVSMIPDDKKYFVKNYSTRKNVGVLDEAFVSEYLQEGKTFITRGKAWKVVSIEDNELIVEQAEDYTAAVPDWVGQEIPVEEDTAQLVLSFFQGKNQDVLKEYCDEPALKSIEKLLKKQAEYFTPEKVVIEFNGDAALMHSFAGNKANEALARIFGAFFSSALGSGVRTNSNTYGVFFEFPQPVSLEKLSTLIETASKSNVEVVLEKALLETSLYRRLFVHNAKRMGAIKKDADYSSISLKRLVKAFQGSIVEEEALKELKHEYFDLASAKKCLSKEKQFLVVKNWSPLAQAFFSFGGFTELFVPADPTSQVTEAFKKSLEEKTVRLKCLYCNKTFAYALSSSEQPACFYCNSKRLTLEKAKGNDAERIGSLVSSYGKNALIALETYGVGSENAARVLSRLHKNEDEFYVDLLEAQKTFMRTKKYWRV
ncbi:DEAD/DEAH box helicase [Candidatus Micrarchaeota archaeon]|nr:DEAD/DEAH box helicase [Candidatus Micrarchaeota archaeon]